MILVLHLRKHFIVRVFVKRAAGVNRMTHVLFILFVFVCAQWCPRLIALCFRSVCLRLVYPIQPVSPGCPILIVSSVFSTVYLSLSYTLMVCSFIIFRIHIRFTPPSWNNHSVTLMPVSSGDIINVYNFEDVSWSIWQTQQYKAK